MMEQTKIIGELGTVGETGTCGPLGQGVIRENINGPIREVSLSLIDYFERNGFKTSWDFDRRWFMWVEVFWNDKVFLHVDASVTVKVWVEFMVKHIKAVEAGESFDQGFYVACPGGKDKLCEFFSLFEDVKAKL